ncbi:MAG: dihydroneopterin aldolase [Actinomycetes bacterium]|jgi:dihydroneopterin aldolase
MDRILVSGLRVLGVHGVLPEEKVRAQPFGIDLELHVDLAAAGASDVLADTVDYGGVARAVAAVVADERYELLERLAVRIIEVCKTDPRVSAVTVTLQKLRPPVPVALDSVGVRITR